MAAGSAANLTSTGTTTNNTTSTTAKVVGTASTTVSGLTSAKLEMATHVLRTSTTSTTDFQIMLVLAQGRC